jgi:hypothetical protein
MTYEETLLTLIFKNHIITLQGFTTNIEELFCLTKDEALLFSRYLFERRNKPKVVLDKSAERRCSLLIRRLREFVGKYNKIESEDMSDIKIDFNDIKDKELQTKFVDKLKDLTHCQSVSPFDIFSLVETMNVKIDAFVLVVYVCRLS